MSPTDSIPLRTASGKMVDVAHLRPEDVDIHDIASALSRICRFNGHLRADVGHYSVAQHSVEVARLLRTWGWHPDVQLYGLLHDAAEAYVGDVVTNLKRALVGYVELEAAVEDVILNKYVPIFHEVEGLEDIHVADQVLLRTEQHYLQVGVEWHESARAPWEIIPTYAEIAEQDFLNTFRRLTDRRPAFPPAR